MPMNNVVAANKSSRRNSNFAENPYIRTHHSHHPENSYHTNSHQGYSYNTHAYERHPY